MFADGKLDGFADPQLAEQKMWILRICMFRLSSLENNGNYYKVVESILANLDQVMNLTADDIQFMRFLEKITLAHEFVFKKDESQYPGAVLESLNMYFKFSQYLASSKNKDKRDLFLKYNEYLNKE